MSLSRIYIWSILTEPLLFFLIADVNIVGVGTGISRLLQLLVLLLLFLKIFAICRTGGILSISNIFDWQFSFFWIFLLWVVFSGVFGALFDNVHQVFQNYNYNRLFIEYLVTLYYFVYFVVMPRFFIKSKQDIQYLLKVATIIFLLVIFLGYIDLVAQSLFEVDLIARHLLDGVDVGVRFHSLFGEPRDAGVGLLFFLSMYLLYTFYHKVAIKKTLLVLTTFALIFTFSLSVYIGIVFSVIFLLRSVSFKFLLILILSSVVALYTAMHTSKRMNLYTHSFLDLSQTMSDSMEIDGLLSSQSVDIFPVWHRWSELQKGDVLSILFGGGIGTSSVVNKMHIETEDSVLNPRSNIVRMFFDIGLIGLMLFVLAFVYPVSKMSLLSASDRRAVLSLVLILLGFSFAHRSAVGYIFLGLILAIYRYFVRETKIRI